MEWVETTGSTIELAKDEALDRLGIHEEDAEFEVLSEGKTGWFGRQKQQARVRARVRPTTPRPKESQGKKRSHSGRQSRSGNSRKPSKPGSVAKRKKSGPPLEKPKTVTSKDVGKDKKMRQELSLTEQADLAESFVKGLAETMGIALTFTRQLKNDIWRIEAMGDNIGFLIGPGGNTAQAVNDLVHIVLQRSGGTTREGKIQVDIGGVRTRRAEALETFTRRIASEVLSSGEDVALDPMNRADRKIVHNVASGLEGIDSYSHGEEPQRRIVIRLSQDGD